MRTFEKNAGSVLLALILLSVFVWAALAEDSPGKGDCCGTAAVQKATGACPDSGVCPMTGACPALASGLGGAAVSVEQTQCPVMNALTKKALFQAYPGKKVHLRCPGLGGTVKKNPEKYRSKSPQFSI